MALFLRTIHLGTAPYGFHVDEVKVGWNSYSILKTGSDDWGHKFALHYNTFGDFRPTGIFYITIPSIIIFGLNVFAIRFPSALLGALSVIPLFYFVKSLSKNSTVSLIAGLMLAISQWHISLSRATSEGIIAMFFVLCGLSLLIRFLEFKEKRSLILSFVFLLPAFFFYHSARVLAPILTFSTVFYYWKNIKIKLFKSKPLLIFSLFVIFITLIFTLNKDARARLSQVSIFSDLGVQHFIQLMPFEEGNNNVFAARLFHNKLIVYGTKFVEEYSQYFSSKYLLVFGEGKPARYTTVGNGVLSYAEFILFILGLIAIFKGKAPFLIILLLLLSPLPAALTTEDTPNMMRSLFMIPFISITEAFGIYLLRNKTLYIIPLLIFFFFNSIFFYHMYFVHNKVHEPIPVSRNVGAVEAVREITKLENSYERIVLSNIPDVLYPWYAFLTRQDPKTFNLSAKSRDQGTWSFGKITFSQFKCPTSYQDKYDRLQKTVFVDSEGCDYKNLDNKLKILAEIKRPEGGIPYTFWGTN